jgi:phosphoglucosamine mutase
MHDVVFLPFFRIETMTATATAARKLFGTDGIRAVAGESPLDPTTIYAVGLALAHTLRRHTADPAVILGRDTRESSPWIAATLAAGLRTAGARVESAGVVPTPAVAFLAHTHGFNAGVVISASHNPWRDNGIKLFGPDGFKLADQVELAMEDEILHHAAKNHAPDPATLPPVEDNPHFQAEFIQFLIDSVPSLKIDGMSIVADCANGAAAAIAPELFRRLNANQSAHIALLNTTPDGRNINDGCGALHPDYVAAETQRRGAHIGLSFDGDADRCMMAGSKNNVLNGDAILLAVARDLKARGLLTGDLVVATTMSNMGLEAALKRSAIRMERAPVGDRYVLEQMLKHNAALGGEQSGHILMPHLATTGDGLLTALVVLDLIVRTGQSIDQLTADLKVYPQIIVNIKVREKRPLGSIPAVADAIRAAEEDLKDSGRVVIRYSGTEALARVMIEAESEASMQHHATAVADAIRHALGV